MPADLTKLKDMDFYSDLFEKRTVMSMGDYYQTKEWTFLKGTNYLIASYLGKTVWIEYAGGVIDEYSPRTIETDELLLRLPPELAEKIIFHLDYFR